MSSSGIISKTIISPTTILGERFRKNDSAITGAIGIHEQNKRTQGVITELHKDKPRLIKAKALDGTPLANDSWIELNHSAQEIAERWGTVRVGFRVRVTFSGPSGAGADATIISIETKDVTEPHQPNEAARGVYAIFAPGVGIG